MSENKITNYQKELDKITGAIDSERRPSLLLHSCCAPCSSYCMEYLREYFDITVFYYNPNISSDPEYMKRLNEEIRLIGIYNDQVHAYRERGVQPAPSTGMEITDRTGLIDIVKGDYEPDRFYEAVKGYEDCPEGGDRCHICYELRIRESYRTAIRLGLDYVTTTLTISPLKNAAVINDIGYRLETELGSGVKWLPSDFKKREGYKRSIELSAVFGLYRQNFCGCVFGKKAMEQ